MVERSIIQPIKSSPKIDMSAVRSSLPLVGSFGLFIFSPSSHKFWLLGMFVVVL